MIIHKIKFLNSINYWNSFPIVEFLVEKNETTSQQMLKLNHFLKELNSEIYQESAIENVLEFFAKALIDLQNRMGDKVSFYEIKPLNSNQFFILISYQDKELTDQLINFLKTILSSSKQDFLDLMEGLQNIQKQFENNRLGPSTGHIVDAAIQKGIPYKRLNDGSLIQFGQGKKLRRIRATITDTTSAITDYIAQDKMITKHVLMSYGIPMPQGCIVSDFLDAHYAALDLGYPVVVKPLSGHQGEGVTINILDKEHLKCAFEHAQKFESSILIEKHISGYDYRLLVVGQQLVAASHRLPPYVIGDGKNTILQLIEMINQDPRRLEEHNGILSKIIVDDIVLATLKDNHYTLDTVLPMNKKLILRQNANLSTGGTAIDVTDEVHPSVAAYAEKIAKVLNIDICGIDLVCKNISEPLTAQTGAFIEVNLAPGLRMHIAPSEGQARPVGQAVMEMLFSHDDGRIPIVAVTGTNGKTTTSKIIAFILQAIGHHVGLTCTDGVYIQNKKLFSGDCSGPYSAETVLMHPDVTAAVFETARGGILRRGLGFDKANVAVFTNIGQGDHLGQDHIHTKEELCNVKATLLRSIVDGVAIFNADDEELIRLASNFEGQKILFSMKENNPYIEKQIAAEQKVVFYDKNHKQIILKSKTVRHQIPVSQIKITHNATIEFQIMNLMAAIAAVWAMDINLDGLLSILESMHSSHQLALGRFNVFSINDRNLIVDYGHNFDATIALIDTLKHFPEKRRVLMISRPGDRQDEDIMSQMAELSHHFDEVIIYQENHLRSRQDGEILEVLQKGFSLESRVKHLHTIKDEQEALNFTLGRINQDDLGLLILDSLESGIEQIHQYYAREQ